MLGKLLTPFIKLFKGIFTGRRAAMPAHMPAHICADMRSAMEPVESRLLLAGNGLSATYFDNADLTGKSVARVDATVNFDWAAGSPNSAIAADTFSARWSGQVEAQKSEQYTFFTTSDDGVRLWVDGKQIISNWSDHAVKEDKGVISLQAGKRYNFKLEYYERSAGAVIKLAWASATTARAIIPQSQLYSTAPITPPVPPPALPVGDGLYGTYFDNDNLTGKTIGRVDKGVNFSWGKGGPDAAINAETFSARWTGQVLAPVTQEYTFFTQSDDGVRLFINGVKIIENWLDHATKEDSGKIKLEAGKKYDIKVEYFERTADAVMQLRWSGAATPKGIVPSANLFSIKPVPQPSPIPPTPTPGPIPTPTPTNQPGLLGSYYNSTNFTGSSVTRVDSNIAFDWGTSSPHEVVGSEGWSARWLGQINISKAETVTFYITSDEQSRLYIDGQLVINDWTAHGKREVSGSIALQPGKHDIKMEFIDLQGQALMQLRYSSASIAKQYVPSSVLTAAKPPEPPYTLPAAAVHTGFKTFTNSQVNFRPGSPSDKDLVLDGYRLSKLPIDTKGMNIAVTDLQPGQKAWSYRNITIRNTEISDLYRTAGYHNDFIRIAGAAGNQDVPINITLENINIHTGTAIPILITDGDYDTIIIRNVKITDCSVNQLQINTQRVGSIKRIIVENSPGLSVAIMGRVGTIGEAIVHNSPGARVSDSLNQQGTKSGVKITVLP